MQQWKMEVKNALNHFNKLVEIKGTIKVKDKI